MPIYVQTNVSSMFAQSNLTKTQNSMQTTFARLSSGFRINSAADDAAGLAISESFNAQVRSFGVAERNANDAISMVQTADGAAAQLGGILTRMRELGVQAQNGTLSSGDRANVDTEYQALLGEIDRIANVSSFNGQKLLDGTAGTSGAVDFQVGTGTTANDRLTVTFRDLTSAGTGLAVTGTSVTSAANAATAVGSIDTAINTLNTQRAAFGAAMNRFGTAISNIQSTKTNLASALGRIRDVDVAEESANMAKNQVLSQAGAAILAQANQAPQLALSLLRG